MHASKRWPTSEGRLLALRPGSRGITLLGDVAGIRDALTNATTCPAWALLSTPSPVVSWAQVCFLVGADEEVLDPLKVPSVARRSVLSPRCSSGTTWASPMDRWPPMQTS